jgi:hypothetical protein
MDTDDRLAVVVIAPASADVIEGAASFQAVKASSGFHRNKP